jgi:transposase-like protein
MNHESEAWTAERRVALVLQILRGEGSLEELASRQGIDPSQAEAWTRCFVEAGEDALQSAGARRSERAYLHIRELERKLGEMALEMDRLRKQLLGTRASG